MKRIVLSFVAFLFAVLTFAQTTANQPKAMNLLSWLFLRKLGV